MSAEANRCVDFRSDNTGTAAPQIVAAIAAANSGTATAYGNDRWSREVDHRFGELFGADVAVLPVATGTAANALSLAAISLPWGAVYCGRDAHVDKSEANAASFLGGGIKLTTLEGDFGKISAASLERTLGEAGIGISNRSQPAAVSVTQATDFGAIHRLDELAAVAEVARRHNLSVHVDGARLANALVALGCSPAELAAAAGVDVLSFGVTKNGGLLCDAIVAFDPAIAERLRFLLRRSGHTWSKMRFAAAQLLAYLDDGLWLKNATRANALAARIRAALPNIPRVKAAFPIEANEIFLEIESPHLNRIERSGISFFRRGPTLARFICRFDTSDDDVDALLVALADQAEAVS